MAAVLQQPRVAGLACFAEKMQDARKFTPLAQRENKKAKTFAEPRRLRPTFSHLSLNSVVVDTNSRRSSCETNAKSSLTYERSSAHVSLWMRACFEVGTPAHPVDETAVQSQQHPQLIHAVQVQTVVLVTVLAERRQLAAVIVGSNADWKHRHAWRKSGSTKKIRRDGWELGARHLMLLR